MPPFGLVPFFMFLGVRVTNLEMKDDCLVVWKERLNATIEEVLSDLVKYRPGVSTCAFCFSYWANGCHGCPIRKATGVPFCKGTPYAKADKAFTNFIDSPSNECFAVWQDACAKEVEFIENLEV